MEFRRIHGLPPYVFTIIDSLKVEARRAGEQQGLLIVSPSLDRVPRIPVSLTEGGVARENLQGCRGAVPRSDRRVTVTGRQIRSQDGHQQTGQVSQ